MRNLIIAVVIVAALGLGYFLLRGSNSSGSNPGQSSGTQTSDACAGAPQPISAVTVTYSGNGFSPSLVSLKASGTLTVKNRSSSSVVFESNPHPIHTDDTDLNIGEIAAGQEKTVTLAKTGCFVYHNHLSSGQTGKILVR